MFGLGLVRLLPPSLRPWLRAFDGRARRRRSRAAARPLFRALERRPRPAYRGERVAILGVFRSPIGIGRAAECLARELEGRGAAVDRVDVTEFFDLPIGVDSPATRGFGVLADPAVTDVIVNLNPPEFYEIARRLDPAVFASKPLIGYFAWELSRVPDDWRDAVMGADEVWVPSAFVRDGIEAAFPRTAPRLLVSPHVVDEALWRPADADARTAARRALGLAEDGFVALTSFAMTSSFARKNPLGAIAAFRAAFPEHDRDAMLLVRCLDARVHPAGLAALEAAAAADPRVRLIVEGDRGGAMLACYQASDALVSLHRGEGFGLNVAEALAMRIPVVATTYSMNQGFLADPLFHGVASRQVPIEDPQGQYVAAGVTWADPDVGEAAAALRALRAARPRLEARAQ